MSVASIVNGSLALSNLAMVNTTTQGFCALTLDTSNNIVVNGSLSVNDTLITNTIASNNSTLTTTFEDSVTVNGVSTLNGSPNSLVITNNVDGSSGNFSGTLNAQILSVNNNSIFPTMTGQAQICFYNGALYFLNPANGLIYNFVFTGPVAAPN
jgi:hypothetical protein